MSTAIYRSRTSKSKRSRSNRKSSFKSGLVTSTVYPQSSEEISYNLIKPNEPTTSQSKSIASQRLIKDMKESSRSLQPYYLVYSDGHRPIVWRKPNYYVREIFLKRRVITDLKEAYCYNPLNKIVPTKLPNSVPVDYLTMPPLKDIELSFKEKQNHFLNFNKKLANQKVDVLTTLAESKATANMLADAAYDLFTLYRNARKGNFRGVNRFLKKRRLKRTVKHHWRKKTAENRWLELQYGWLPLIGDISTAMKAYAENQASPYVFKVTHSTKKPAISNSGLIVGDRIFKTSCYYIVKNETLRSAAQWNLGINPLLTAWEIVPYSFIVDWFIPIGDFLQQFSSSAGLQFVSGTSVSYTRANFELKTSPYYVYVPEGYFLFNSVEKITFSRTNRTVHLSSPIGFPIFDFTATIGKALNALALVSQKRK